MKANSKKIVANRYQELCIEYDRVCSMIKRDKPDQFYSRMLDKKNQILRLILLHERILGVNAHYTSNRLH